VKTPTELSEAELDAEYDEVSDRVLTWQALDAVILDELRRLNDLTQELNRRSLQRAMQGAGSAADYHRLTPEPGREPEPPRWGVRSAVSIVFEKESFDEARKDANEWAYAIGRPIFVVERDELALDGWRVALQCHPSTVAHSAPSRGLWRAVSVL
jgi:hypothetical protein